MSNVLSLAEMPETSLDHVLSLSNPDKIKYFASLIDTHYPTVNDKLEREKLIHFYCASFVLEKILRHNSIIKHNFTAVYTKTGLIRNIVSDMYFNRDDLTTH